MAKGIRRGASAGGTGGVAGKTFVQYWVDQGKTYTAWVDYGDSVLSPSSFTPTKTGYTFLGWKETNVADGDVLVTKVAETRFLTLYAVFTRTVTVTYYDNSTTATTSTKTIYYNNTHELYPIFTLTQAAKSNWTARGWTEFATGGDSVVTYQNGESFNRDSDITLYGCYQRTVTLSYNNNGGTGEMASETGTAYYHTISGETDATFILDENTFTKTDYQFVQWRLNSASGTAYQPLDTYESYTDDTMYAEWMVLSTLVRYNVDVSTYYEEFVPRGDSVLSPSTFTPTKTGYTFLGWKDSGIASSDVLVTKTASGDNMTLYAVFTDSFNIYLYNASNSPTVVPLTSYYNNMDTLYPSYTCNENAISGWTKLGWTGDPDGYTAYAADGESVNFPHETNLYSLYSKSVTLTYYNSNATANTDTGTRYANIHSTTTYSNPEFELPAQIELTNWTTRGWTTGAAGNSTITHTSGVPFTLTDNTSIYGCYERTVTVSYNANGGTGTIADQTATAYYHSKNGAVNASIVLASSGYTKTGGYTLYRWRLNSASGTAYAKGATYASTSDAIMYAEWVAAQAKTFNYTGGVQSYTAYAGVQYRIQCYGAQGGGGLPSKGTGANGAYTIGYRTPSSNETWYIYVGGAGGTSYVGWDNVGSYNGSGGYNGGGAGKYGYNNNYSYSGSGGGGGASSISTTNAAASGANIAIAGGGGGAAYNYYASGSATANGNTSASSNGVRGTGSSTGNSILGAGGGGYYGGKAGNNVVAEGGYSGTNYTGGTASSSTSQGQRSGNGQVVITPII
jgi:uncharacterized repeat protein (TIGR02543 family)